jgi:hypothetical protein
MAANIGKWANRSRTFEECEAKLAVTTTADKHRSLRNFAIGLGHDSFRCVNAIAGIMVDEGKEENSYLHNHTVLLGQAPMALLMLVIVLNSPTAKASVQAVFSVVNGVLIFDKDLGPTVIAVGAFINQFLKHVSWIVVLNETVQVLTLSTSVKATAVVGVDLLDDINPDYRYFVQKKLVAFSELMATRFGADRVSIAAHSGLFRDAGIGLVGRLPSLFYNWDEKGKMCRVRTRTTSCSMTLHCALHPGRYWLPYAKVDATIKTKNIIISLGLETVMRDVLDDAEKRLQHLRPKKATLVSLLITTAVDLL